MPQTRTRNSDWELLRILCMLLIIGDHLTGQSGITSYASLPSSFLFCLLGSGSRLACNVFVLLGGWFLSEQPFQTRRPLSLWLSLWLYTVPVTLLCALAGLPVTAGDIRWAIFPASTRQLWFISAYLVLLLCTPLLNRALHHLPRAAHKALLVTLAVPLVAYPTLFAENGMVGEEAWVFLYLYLLVAYLRRWPDNALARLFGRRALAAAVGFGIPVILSAARAVLEWQGATGGKAMQYVAYYRTGLGALPNIAAAVALLYLFKGLPVGQNRVINKIAGSTLGVYILHQVPVLRNFLWNGIFRCEENQGSLPYALFVVFAVFAGATVLDMLRTKLLLSPLQRSKPFAALCRQGDAIAAKFQTDD